MRTRPVRASSLNRSFLTASPISSPHWLVGSSAVVGRHCIESPSGYLKVLFLPLSPLFFTCLGSVFPVIPLLVCLSYPTATPCLVHFRCSTSRHPAESLFFVGLPAVSSRRCYAPSAKGFLNQFSNEPTLSTSVAALPL